MYRKLLPFAVMVVIGCGQDGHPPLGLAEGVVTLNGRPIADGDISFSDSQKGFAASCKLAPDGTFRLRCQYGAGVPVGRYQVSITPPGIEPERRNASTVVDSSIPKKYQNAATSGLEVEVRRGGEPFRFDLQL